MQCLMTLRSVCTSIGWLNRSGHRDHRGKRENLLLSAKNGFSLWSLCALWLIVFALSACGREPVYQSQSYVFGTLVDITIYGEDETRAAKLAEHIQQDFQRLHQKLHAWDESSELSRINRAIAAGESVSIDTEMADMLEQAGKLSAASNGLFNPAIGGLIKHWGFQRDSFSAVEIDPAAIEALVAARPGMEDIRIERHDDGITLSSRNPAVRFDLGGYAKGYALDRAAAYLKSEQAGNALINIGGNIIALGRHGERPWHVGIQHPRKSGAIASLDLEDGWAIGTSGDYQRYFELDGVRYCHVLDPRSGYPASHLQAVTVLLPPDELAGTRSDTDSKPLFITEPENHQAMAQQLGLTHYMMIDRAGNISVSAPMQKRLKWKTDAATRIQTLP
jgi:thiamine biosynthesis lipoprotein